MRSPVQLILFSMLTICNNLNAQTLFEFSNSELTIRSRLQYDLIDDGCKPINCNLEDGRRVFDISARYNNYTSINSLVFAEINFDQSADVGTDALLTSFSTHEQYPNAKTIDRAFVGSQIEKFAISIGKQTPVTSGFSLANNAYINFNLTAFADDRFLITGGAADNIVSRVDWSDRYRIAISSGIAEKENLIPDLDYEFLFDSPLFESRGIHVTAAHRSVNIEGADDFKASGVKLSWFRNNGNLYEVAFSKNDIGEYTEFLFRRDWNYRNRLELGVSRFNVNKNGEIEEVKVASDSEFVYLNYTFFISHTTRWFVEGSKFNSDTLESKAALSGLEYSF